MPTQPRLVTALLAAAALSGARASLPKPVDTIMSYEVDLTKSPEARWGPVLKDFLQQRTVAAFIDYYSAALQELLQKDQEAFLFYKAHLKDFEAAYKEQFPDSLAEMKALSDLLTDMAKKDSQKKMLTWDKVFMAQLAAELRNIGPKEFGDNSTSAVLRLSSGPGMVHIFNWDAAVAPDAVGSSAIRVEFHEAGKRNFTCLLSLTEITKYSSCIKPKGFSMSAHVRPSGDGQERGRTGAEELRLLKLGHPPPAEVLRRVMRGGTFGEALAAAATSRPANSAYVVLADGGAGAVQDLEQWPGAAIVTLFGNGSTADVLPMKKPSEEDGWFMVQTSVDHWVETSHKATSSHRRDHLAAMLHILGPDATPARATQSMLSTKVFPKNNKGKDHGRLFGDSTVATVVMAPGDHAQHNTSHQMFLWNQLKGAGGCAGAFKQCGGKDFDGPTCCETGCRCNRTSEYYWQCNPPDINLHHCPRPDAFAVQDISPPEVVSKSTARHGDVGRAAQRDQTLASVVPQLAVGTATFILLSGAVWVLRRRNCRGRKGQQLLVTPVDEVTGRTDDTAGSGAPSAAAATE